MGDDTVEICMCGTTLSAMKEAASLAGLLEAVKTSVAEYCHDDGFTVASAEDCARAAIGAVVDYGRTTSPHQRSETKIDQRAVVAVAKVLFDRDRVSYGRLPSNDISIEDVSTFYFDSAIAAIDAYFTAVSQVASEVADRAGHTGRELLWHRQFLARHIDPPRVGEPLGNTRWVRDE